MWDILIPRQCLFIWTFSAVFLATLIPLRPMELDGVEEGSAALGPARVGAQLLIPCPRRYPSAQFPPGCTHCHTKWSLAGGGSDYVPEESRESMVS